MPTPPKWTCSHNDWKQLKKTCKNETFPNTGTGKALDKIESLCKKINWKAFENFKGLAQDFFVLHAKNINPFLKAVRNAVKKIRDTSGMPKPGIAYARLMEEDAAEFTIDALYFRLLLKDLDSIVYARDRIDQAAGVMAQLSIMAVIGTKAAYDILLEYAKKRKFEESVFFLKAIHGRMPPAAIYERFVRPGATEEININSDIQEPLTEKYNSRTLKLGDFAVAARQIEMLLKNNCSWPTLVSAWKDEQYKKYKIPML